MRSSPFGKGFPSWSGRVSFVQLYLLRGTILSLLSSKQLPSAVLFPFHLCFSCSTWKNKGKKTPKLKWHQALVKALGKSAAYVWKFKSEYPCSFNSATSSICLTVTFMCLCTHTVFPALLAGIMSCPVPSVFSQHSARPCCSGAGVQPSCWAGVWEPGVTSDQLHPGGTERS